eukprot:2925473-Rhodomonas_salina.1
MASNDLSPSQGMGLGSDTTTAVLCWTPDQKKCDKKKTGKSRRLLRRRDPKCGLLRKMCGAWRQ